MTKEQASQSERLVEKYKFEPEMTVTMEQSRYIALMLGIAYELSDEDIAKYMDIQPKMFTDVDLKRICVMLGIDLPKEADKEITLGQLKDIIHGEMQEKDDKKETKSENSASQGINECNVAEESSHSDETEDTKKEDEMRCDLELLNRYERIFEKYHITLEEAEAGDILIKNMVSTGKSYSRLTNYVLNSKELSPAQLQLVLKAVKEKIPEEFILRFALPEVSAFQMEKAIEIYQIRKKAEKKHSLIRRE